MRQRDFLDRHLAGRFIEFNFRNGSSHRVGPVGSGDPSARDLGAVRSGCGGWPVGPARLLGRRDEDFGDPLVTGEVFQAKLKF